MVRTEVAYRWRITVHRCQPMLWTSVPIQHHTHVYTKQTAHRPCASRTFTQLPRQHAQTHCIILSVILYQQRKHAIATMHLQACMHTKSLSYHLVHLTHPRKYSTDQEEVQVARTWQKQQQVAYVIMHIS